MKVNRTFAERSGMTTEMMQQADSVYAIISDALNGMYEEVHTEKIIESCEYVLQALFGSPLDNTKHRYTREYKFKKQWVGRKYCCNTTGEVFTIPDGVYETAFYSFGNAFVDVGRLNFYARFSNCTEIKETLYV